MCFESVSGLDVGDLLAFETRLLVAKLQLAGRKDLRFYKVR